MKPPWKLSTEEIVNKNLNDFWDDEKTTPVFDNKSEEISLELVVDESISPAHFKKLKDSPLTFAANSLTIRAVKRDLFVWGDTLEHARYPRDCKRCSKEIDWQFWSLCPYCGQDPS